MEEGYEFSLEEIELVEKIFEAKIANINSKIQVSNYKKSLIDDASDEGKKSCLECLEEIGISLL
ncbi:hypothetical protein RyT2_29460 [Pseudolactococcus yaeyamensis]